MGPLNGHGELYFLWQDVSLLSQNCPKTCGFTHWWLQCILEIMIRKNTIWKFYQFKTKLKWDTYFWHDLFFVMYKIKWKGIFVGYDKQSSAYLIYFLETMTIKRVRCVKFTDFYDNSSLSKPDKNTENPEYLIIYEVETEDNPNTKEEGQITHYSIWQRKRCDFFCSRKLGIWSYRELLYCVYDSC